MPAPGRCSLARKDVKITLTQYRVLSAMGGCALLQLQPKTGEWPLNTSTTPAMLPDPCNLASCSSSAFPEQLQVHLTLLLCPALGDHEHSSHVGRVLGVPFFLTPGTVPTRTQVRGQGGCWVGHSAQASVIPLSCSLTLQVLDEELLSRLGLSPRQLHHLPLHIHLQELVLPEGPLCAPPPPYFLHSLRCLGLPEH